MNWFRKLLQRGPQARVVIASGTHVENLARHPHVDIPQLGTDPDTNLPVWVDVDPSQPTTQTYDGLLWEIEPRGEYLYYLAGDFPKNDKGLLRYASTKTRAEVHVTFESDAIGVASHDGRIAMQNARDNAAALSDFANMTVADVTAFARGQSAQSGYNRNHVVLDIKLPTNALAFAECADPFQDGPHLVVHCDLLDENGPARRLTSIRIATKDGSRQISDLIALARVLVERYGAIPNHKLTGAIRM